MKRSKKAGGKRAPVKPERKRRRTQEEIRLARQAVTCKHCGHIDTIAEMRARLSSRLPNFNREWAASREYCSTECQKAHWETQNAARRKAEYRARKKAENTVPLRQRLNDAIAKDPALADADYVTICPACGDVKHAERGKGNFYFFAQKYLAASRRYAYCAECFTRNGSKHSLAHRLALVSLIYTPGRPKLVVGYKKMQENFKDLPAIETTALPESGDHRDNDSPDSVQQPTTIETEVH